MKFKYLLLAFFFLPLLSISTAVAQESKVEKWISQKEILKEIKTPFFPDREFNVIRFGATEKNILPAIQKAINTANFEGGGKVIVPKGTWFVKGPIHLKSNVHLYLEKGSELVFSENPEDYLPQVLTRWEGTEAFNFSPLIYGYNVDNVAITGAGKLNGNAEFGFATWRDKQKTAQDKLREMGNTGIPVHERVFGLEDYLRPSFIQFYSSSNILIEGVQIENSPMWCNHFIYSSNIIVRNITVNSHRLNNDGVVIDSSTLVLIEKNSFSTGDDSIVIKSGRDAEGRKIARPSEGILIRNNYMEGHNALAVGSEMSGGISHVFMENNKLGTVSSAIYFKSNLDRGGFIRHVRVSDIQVDSSEVLIRFDTNYHSYRGGDYPSLYQDFRISDVTANFAKQVFEIKGVSEFPVENVFISDVNVISALSISDIQYVENLSFSNIEINLEEWNYKGE